MTYGDLAAKYGEAVSGRLDTYHEGGFYYYSFAGSHSGYRFYANEASEKKLSDGTPVPDSNTVCQVADFLQVKDLVIGMKDSVTIKEFIDLLGYDREYQTGTVPGDNSGFDPYNFMQFPYYTAFGFYAYDNAFPVGGAYYHIEHTEIDIIAPDSYLRLFYQGS